MTSSTERIAIVGLGIRLPGAGPDPNQFWDRVAAATDCSTDIPTGRWYLPPELCLDPRVAHPDTVHTSRGYYLDPFEPDLTGLEIDRALVAELDRLFQIVLDAGNRAWRSARTAPIDRSRVGVVLGNICLPTEKSNALCREVLGGAWSDHSMIGRQAAHPLNRYVAGLPAGVLAKSLGLGGGSFTLDAACASSLYAIKLAADELLAGRADAMLAGGVNGSDPQYTQMGFAQLRALSASGRCSPFDARADGLMVGEGAAVFMLKRLSDAIAAGDTIHAVIAGVGLSNDMHGNLLAPAKEGQLRAMRRAYEMAGWMPHEVDLIECHATGTPVGDAVEFDSLRELWGSAGWKPGSCVIGSVKSTVGHLLTGAGAAAVTKVLGAMSAGVLLPQANFAEPAPGLKYEDGPFRVLAQARPWERRKPNAPRRAAVSGFGFGGVNAHVLLEEWTGQESSRVSVPVPREVPPPGPIAVVGMAAHFGSWKDLRSFQERVLGGDAVEPAPKENGWGLADQPSPPGYYIEELQLPIGRFRIPPKELDETLPQQLLMLQVADAALEDCRSKRDRDADDPRAGTFIGLGLDLNTTNYHLRWSLLANRDREGAGEVLPALNANRVMGALGSIAASRIARAFHFGGPSHTVCSEEASAARALELAVRALQAGEIDRALVGGVDLAGDPRIVLPGEVEVPGEGAAAVVLKRLADAERDGDRVYAVITGVGTAGGDSIEEARNRAAAEAPVHGAIAFDATTDIGQSGAASAAASLVKTCLAVYQEILPGDPSPKRGGEEEVRWFSSPSLVGKGVGGLGSSSAGSLGSPRYWLHDRVNGPRRAVVASTGADGTAIAVVIEEYAKNTAAEIVAADRLQPLGARDEAVFVVEGASPADLSQRLSTLADFAGSRRSRNIESIARHWFRQSPPDPARPLAVALVARSADDVAAQVAFAIQSLRRDPTQRFPADPSPVLRDRLFYSPQPPGPQARVAFVFPGSGNQFDGMGRDLGAQWPEILRRQQTESELLRSQFAPDLFWDGRTAEATHRDLMFGQVTVGSLVADVVSSVGVRGDAMIGLSLGESAGLFGIRAWRSRDEMYRRMRESTLFNSDLAPPYDAARRFWDTAKVDWTAAVVAAPPEQVRTALRPESRAFLLIVNTPGECVIGGERSAVEELAAAIGRPWFPLSGVTLAHCEVGRPVEQPYRELHTLPVSPPDGVTVYSGAWGKSYAPTSEAAAESIAAGLLGLIDVPRVVEAAYRDGVRAFIEVGPGASCTRMIDAILGDRPHLAVAAHAAGAGAVSQILRVVASLAAERVPVDLAALYGRETLCIGHREQARDTRPMVIVPVGNRPVVVNTSDTAIPLDDEVVPPPYLVPAIEAACDARVEAMKAQEAFLRVNQGLMESAASVLRMQTALLQQWVAEAGAANPFEEPDPPAPSLQNLTPRPPSLRGKGEKTQPTSCSPSLLGERPGEGFNSSPPRALSFEQCCAFAAGRVADALGPLFAEVDTFPTRVRLPDGPLQLVDRITLIEGEPRSMKPGRVVTEHAVHADRWYLEAGRIPTAISVEAGQADLFLSGFLGIDFETRGLAVYRLLDAVVSFHRGLPKIGETAVYDIRIDDFSKQGDSWLFRFQFDGTVNGEPFITMRNGVAGFFTAEALAAGRGIVQTSLDRQRLPGKKPDDWRDLVPQRECCLDSSQVEAMRRGDLITAFGPDFAAADLRRPMPLPGGMLRLVDRVPTIDPIGGRFGIGFVRGEFDIHPDDWFLTCHFVDDMVMPGTLMYECCLHTLRIFLMRMGWVCEDGEAACEPVPGINSRLKCRGQVIASTKTVAYEVTVKELGFGPEPYCLADALMYADGKAIVEMTNMSLRMTGLSRERLDEIWSQRPNPPAPFPKREGGENQASSSSPPRLGEGLGERSKNKSPLYDRNSILAFAVGKPSEAFGEPYRVFDSDRVIARLPGPPFAFIDRIIDVTGDPFVLKAGAACVAEYDVPPGEWYFEANRCDMMPFAVLLEIALQPCGWLAAYCGSALTSDIDLSFRNLGGKATQFRPITPDSGTLTMSAKMTSVSHSAGMLIQHFDMLVSDRHGKVYEGTTYFGFFTRPQLANQVGIREAKVPWPSGRDVAESERGLLPRDAPFPADMLRMADRIETYLPRGGSKGLGLVIGRIAVDPEFWFFKAHFYQDPVWPGSLGLESFLQLLKYVAWKRWGEPPPGGWQTVALHRPHSWVYRGQVLPTDREVTVVLEVTDADDAARRLTASGFLIVDGRIIYQMADFTLE